MSLFHLHFWKKVLLDIILFFSQHFGYITPFLALSFLMWCQLSILMKYLNMMSFFLANFKFFLSTFLFWCIWCKSLWVYSTCSSFTLMTFIKFGKFSAPISLNIFLFPFSEFSFHLYILTLQLPLGSFLYLLCFVDILCWHIIVTASFISLVKHSSL